MGSGGGLVNGPWLGFGLLLFVTLTFRLWAKGLGLRSRFYLTHATSPDFNFLPNVGHLPAKETS